MKFLRFNDLKQRNIARNWPTLVRLMNQQGFPTGIRIGAPARAWEEAEVEAWLETRRIASPPARPAARFSSAAIFAPAQRLPIFGGMITFPVTIPAGAALSDGLEIPPHLKAVRITTPSAWNTAPITFQISANGADWLDLLHATETPSGFWQPFKTGLGAVIPTPSFCCRPWRAPIYPGSGSRQCHPSAAGGTIR